VSDRGAAARATLARLGLDPDAVAAGRGADDALARLLAGPDAADLVHALGDLPTPAIATLLVRLEASASRAVRKEIRRALYRLRQRGVPIPEPVAPPAAAPARVAAEIEALLSAVDGRGDRVAWLLRPLDTGGALLVAAQLNEPAGLRDVHAVEVARKALRATRDRLEKESGLKLVPADWHVVDALLVEGHERAAGSERDRDYLRVRPRLTREPPRSPAEPVSRRVAPPAPDEVDALVAGSAALLDEPEFRTWWPTADALAPIIAEIGALRDSPIVVSPGAQEERLRVVLRHAAETLLPPAVAARRLEATAYVLAETGRSAPARQALAVATVLRERPAAAADVPFVAVYVERAVGALLAETTARREEEQRSSLVVTPAQFLKDRASARRGHTPR
jgi:hypothetical protein